MTDKQQNQIRSASKFLRVVFDGELSTVASIINAEANILTGTNVSENISTLINALEAVHEGCGDMITKLNKIKESYESV